MFIDLLIGCKVCLFMLLYSISFLFGWFFIMKISKNNKIILSITAIILVAVIVVVLFFPSGVVLERNVYTYSAKKQEGSTFSGEYKEFLSVGDATMFVNEKNGGVAFVNKNTNDVFNASSIEAANSLLSATIDLVLCDERGNSHIFNSYDNSVTYGGFSILESKANKVTLNYEFYMEKGDAAVAAIPLTFYIEDGSIKSKIDLSEVTILDGWCVEDISVLPGLFSVRKAAGDVFYTIPDGSGAQVNLTASIEDDIVNEYSLYGSDITFNDYSSGFNLPCYALTKNKTLLTVVIENGDALSTVTMNRLNGKGGDLYNTFKVTAIGDSEGKTVKGESYNGVLIQSYNMTDKGILNYNTVASITRDYLIKNDYLGTEISNKFIDLPFFITAIASENGNKNDIYTTFENASEIIALLKSKGVRSIALRLAGCAENGLNTSASDYAEFNVNIGTNDEYNALIDTAFDKNSSVWYEVNLSAENSLDMNKGIDVYEDLRAYLEKPSFKYIFSGYNKVNNNISDIYKLMSELNSGNVCVNDLSRFLYTDVKGGVNRQAALDNLKENIGSLSVGGGLMLANPSVYLMKNADAVFAVPEKSSIDGENGVTSVPMLQMVLHGSICYGTSPINVSENALDSLLKAVEFGASPSFVFTHKGNEKLDYGVYASQTAKYYSIAKRMMPLMDMEITSHEKVVSGVYKIIYDYSKIVYVNYNPSVVEVNGVLVSAQDFLII